MLGGERETNNTKNLFFYMGIMMFFGSYGCSHMYVLTSRCKVLLSYRMKHKKTLLRLRNNTFLRCGAGKNACIISSMLGMPYKMNTFEVEYNVHFDTMKQHLSIFFVSVLLATFRVLCHFLV